MLNIEQCRHILEDASATDEEIVRLRDELYRFVNRFLDGHFSEDREQKNPYTNNAPV